MRPSVIVIGAGVNGIGSSLALLQRYPNVDLTVISDKYSPYTTSDIAAGMWAPYFRSDNRTSEIIGWSSKTWDLYQSWLHNKDNWGVSVVSGVTLCDEELPRDPWSHIVYGYDYLTQDQYKSYGAKYEYGIHFTTLFAEASKFLPKLKQNIQDLGGRFKTEKVISLSELAEKYQPDLILNCSGLSSYDIVPDHSMFPIRGQVYRVSAPWQRTYIVDESKDNFTYILPNQDSVIVGGTQYKDDWNLQVDPDDSWRIWNDATNLLPSLKAATIQKESVGLRPARHGGVRIEADDVLTDKKCVPVVHNYGHSGAGISMFWGTSQEAADLSVDIICKRFPPSKL